MAAASNAPQRLTLEYRAGDAAEFKFRQLDLYVTRPGANPVPVLIFVHGGAWMRGNKEHYRNLGRRFAQRGVLAVLPNYRLAPAARNPAQAGDVAAAVAWVFKHAAEYGGDPKRIFLAGHSAGAQIVALVATDPKFLAAHHLQPAALAGVIPISGVYDIAAMAAAGKHKDDFVPNIFGPDPREWQAANPITHIKPAQTAGPGLPKMLVVWAGHDPDYIRRDSAALLAALEENHHHPESLTLRASFHATELLFLGHPRRKLSAAIYALMGHTPEGR